MENGAEKYNEKSVKINDFPIWWDMDKSTHPTYINAHYPHEYNLNINGWMEIEEIYKAKYGSKETASTGKEKQEEK